MSTFCRTFMPTKHWADFSAKHGTIVATVSATHFTAYSSADFSAIIPTWFTTIEATKRPAICRSNGAADRTTINAAFISTDYTA